MEELSFIYKDVDADDMSEITYLKNTPWDWTQKTKGNHQLIDYLLALDQDAKVSKEEALAAMQEKKEMLEAFPPAARLTNEG